jgi:hypothetical protein
VAFCPKSVLAAGAIALVEGAIVPRASAEPSVTDRTQAQLLFNQARSLMTATKYAEACVKFAESQRLDPGGGTLLNLALCHEKQGKTATAWADFNEALSVALRDRRAEREKLAREHIAALEPGLSRLVVQVERAASDAGIAIKIDGREVSRSAWGTPVPVDPEEHHVEASAPAREAWTSRVTLHRGETLTVRVPELKRASSSMATTGSTLSESAPASPDRPRTAGYVTAGAGVAALGVGAAFGIFAIREQKDADRSCSSDRCDPQGLEHNQAAQRDAWISNGFFAVGIAATALGAYWIFAPNDKAAPASRSRGPVVAADVTPTSKSLIVRGTW